MDKRTEGITGHQKVSEFLTFYREALKAASYGNPSGQVDRLKDLMTPIRPHFEFEEREIFPAIIKKGSDEHKKLVEALKVEHVDILGKLDKFDSSVRSIGENPDYSEVHTVLESGKGLVGIIQEHALKEDNELFPHLKDYEVYLR